jgi:cysteine desulfurase
MISIFIIINICEGAGVTVENMTIYMDNSVTTPVRKEVVEDMILYLTENFGNPSSIHDLGKTPKRAIKTQEKGLQDLSVLKNMKFI